MEENKKYKIIITQKDLNNRTVREAVLDLIDKKIREQRATKIIIVSQTEFEIIDMYLKRYLIKAEVYCKDKKDLKYKNEVGKYLGKRLLVTNNG